MHQFYQNEILTLKSTAVIHGGSQEYAKSKFLSTLLGCQSGSLPTEMEVGDSKCYTTTGSAILCSTATQ